MTAPQPVLNPPASDAEHLDVDAVRRDFPILGRAVRGRALVYLDNAATTQKPRPVIDALERYYEEENANIHRGVHFLSQQATFSYERARGRLATFVNAAESAEVVFCRGATEAANLVAHGYGRSRVGEGDEILVTHMEHHSNIVPWQMLCEATGASLKVAPITDEGELDLAAFADRLSPRTRLVAVTHASNVLGTVNPVRRICELAHEYGAVVFVDGAQGAPHLPVDVQGLGCDFYALSGHKLFAPTGIGILYGRRELLQGMAPYEGGGSMIRSVSFEGTTWAEPPPASRPARRTSPAPWAWPRPWTTSTASAWSASSRTRRSCSPGPRDSSPRSRVCASSARPAARSRSSPSPSTAPIPTTSAPSSTPRAWPCAPATTAPSR